MELINFNSLFLWILKMDFLCDFHGTAWNAMHISECEGPARQTKRTYLTTARYLHSLEPVSTSVTESVKE